MTRTKAQYAKHYREYQGRPDQIKKRAQRNAARRQLMKEGKVRKGDGKDVAHKKEIRHGGTNARSNLTVKSHKQRGWKDD